MEELICTANVLLKELIEKKLRSTYCVNVIGPKFCGKTTTCEQFAKSKIKLISQDIIDVVRASPQVALEGERLRLIDEWQTAPILWDKIREQADTEETKFGQYLLTGSATPADQEELNHTGSGRIVSVRMRPMSLYESGESKGKVSIKELFDNPSCSIMRI
jgi:predicted AAA+ superfamily ATPase